MREREERWSCWEERAPLAGEGKKGVGVLFQDEVGFGDQGRVSGLGLSFGGVSGSGSGLGFWMGVRIRFQDMFWDEGRGRGQVLRRGLGPRFVVRVRTEVGIGVGYQDGSESGFRMGVEVEVSKHDPDLNSYLETRPQPPSRYQNQPPPRNATSTPVPKLDLTPTPTPTPTPVSTPDPNPRLDTRTNPFLKTKSRS
ncbi:hypothetical protein TIFTF001_008174 [Ficus carica]|uniref:Uncharacterized protein n=1 Tax=Ficus carica TaxID=3494 RepID=A0AA87ZRZ9_FICCA|nr:hypothetical protein TIFTF001_008174 [Ficus carica]